MKYNELFPLLEKVYYLLKEGLNLQSVCRKVNYPKIPCLLRADLIRAIDYDPKGKNIESKPLIFKHSNKFFFMTTLAKKAYCKQYGLKMNQWEEVWTKHIQENFEKAISSKEKYKINNKSYLVSDELLFNLIGNFIFTIRLRIDNINDHLHDEKVTGLEEVLTY